VKSLLTIPRNTHAEATALIEANRDIAEVLVWALIEHGELSGDEVVMFNCIAVREVEKERQRRIEWKVREASSASFVYQGLSSERWNRQRELLHRSM
jgi:hypothetical protein